MNTFAVDAAHDGARLDVVVADMAGISRAQAARRIDAGEVTVDDSIAPRSLRVSLGQRIAVRERPAAPDTLAPAVPPVRYEDEHLLVLSKPAGLVVHPGSGHEGDTLADALRAAELVPDGVGDPGRPGIVHRLDRDTSGLIIVARTAAAHGALVKAIAARAVTRRYLALVAGVPARAHGRIDGPIGRDPRMRMRFAVVSSGRPAVTHYTLVAEGRVERDGDVGEAALLCCTLETGRTHQIRVHLAGAGHPVLGDTVYGGPRGLSAAVGLARQALHAIELEFIHPITGARVRVVDTVPDDMATACERCGIPVDRVRCPHHGFDAPRAEDSSGPQ
ncbi:MAG: RluA family pseudouridine synthase [Nitriliruptoraceae bacterium]